MWTKGTSTSGYYKQRVSKTKIKVKGRRGTSVPREKEEFFYVPISYGGLGSSGDFVKTFEQSNFEPDIGLMGVFECDTKLFIQVPKLEVSTMVIIIVSVVLKYLLDIHWILVSI